MNESEIAQLKANLADTTRNELSLDLFHRVMDCKEYIEQLERRNAKIAAVFSSVLQNDDVTQECIDKANAFDNLREIFERE